MSVRAYKIIKIETEKEPTFNCLHDDFIFNLASNNDQYNDGGILTYDKEYIQEILLDKDSGATEDDKKILKQIIEDCGEDGYVDYFCF